MNKQKQIDQLPVTNAADGKPLAMMVLAGKEIAQFNKEETRRALKESRKRHTVRVKSLLP